MRRIITWGLPLLLAAGGVVYAMKGSIDDRVTRQVPARPAEITPPSIPINEDAQKKQKLEYKLVQLSYEAEVKFNPGEEEAAKALAKGYVDSVMASREIIHGINPDRNMAPDSPELRLLVYAGAANEQGVITLDSLTDAIAEHNESTVKILRQGGYDDPILTVKVRYVEQDQHKVKIEVTMSEEHAELVKTAIDKYKPDNTVITAGLRRYSNPDNFMKEEGAKKFVGMLKRAYGGNIE